MYEYESYVGVCMYLCVYVYGGYYCISRTRYAYEYGYESYVGVCIYVSMCMVDTIVYHGQGMRMCMSHM